MSEQRKVALGLDEDGVRGIAWPITDKRWENEDSFDPESYRIAEVPAELVEALERAWSDAKSATAALFAAAGVDPETGCRPLCAEWQGAPYESPFNGVVSYGDCEWCGHPWEHHPRPSDTGSGQA